MIVEKKTQRDKIHLKLLSKISGSKEIIFKKIWKHSFWVKWSGMNKKQSFNRNKDPMTFFVLFVFPQLNSSGTMHFMFYHIEELVRWLISESHYIWLKIVYQPPFRFSTPFKTVCRIEVLICYLSFAIYLWSLLVHQRYMHIVITFKMSNEPLKLGIIVVGVKLSLFNKNVITFVIMAKILINVLAPD